MSLPPFDRVVTEHGPVVLRACRALVGGQEAEDVWSETFLSALQAYPRLRAESNVRAWLLKIAHRKGIDRMRAKRRGPLPMHPPPEPTAHQPAPEDADSELWRALAALPLKQRSAIAFHHVAGLPYAKVGELLGSSEAAARRSAADGIAKLRTTLNERSAA